MGTLVGVRVDASLVKVGIRIACIDLLEAAMAVVLFVF